MADHVINRSRDAKMAWNGALFLVVIAAGVLEIRHAASGETSYVNQWAVHIPGGHDVAQRVANELGYINHGQVSLPQDERFLKPVHTVAEKCDCRRIRRLSPLSRRFLRQSHFSATVWTGLYSKPIVDTAQIIDVKRFTVSIFK